MLRFLKKRFLSNFSSSSTTGFSSNSRANFSSNSRAGFFSNSVGFFAGLLVSVWAIFTLALLVWWVVFSLRQLQSLRDLSVQAESEILKNQTMLIYEGVTLFICMLMGSVALIYFVYKENLRLKERKDFLSVFTHDLKTTLTSLSLILERLSKQEDKNKIKSEVSKVQRIGLRLNQQLQNALQFSYFEFNKVYLETVDLKKELQFIGLLWPDLDMDLTFEFVYVKADRSLLRGVISNLIQNSYDHSKSRQIKVESKSNRGKIEVIFKPLDGEPFEGDLTSFKANYNYKKKNDSSGLGLSLSKNIMKKFGGHIDFSLEKQGFLTSHLIFTQGSLLVDEVRK